MVLQFYIELEGSHPLVWRRIIVPASYTFYQLHMAIQGSFGWENSHLFQFSANGLGDNLCYGMPYDDDVPDPDYIKINAKKAKIRQVFKSVGQSICYVYDFGDHWKHRATFENMEMKDLDYPYCLAGEGACPPEDIGGLGGYENMLETFASSDEQEKVAIREWLGLAEAEHWDPAFCSVREVNKRLCLLE